MDDQTDMVNAALRIMRFYQHESCGWCIPCREGTLLSCARSCSPVSTMAWARGKDIDLVWAISPKNMLGRTFCALGDAAAAADHFHRGEKFRHGEFEANLKKKRISRWQEPSRLVNVVTV